MNSTFEIRTYFNTTTNTIEYKCFLNGEEQTDQTECIFSGRNIAVKHLSWPLPNGIFIRPRRQDPDFYKPHPPMPRQELPHRDASESEQQLGDNHQQLPQPTSSPYQPACQECQGESQSSN